ncbi:MAG: hypothetical protein MUD10_00360 [Candidatus Pacebacteria bacterium]|jgi:hypothetical protein|nr:hypothetical protein [Candidatus Paceibacterota bacterium]
MPNARWTDEEVLAILFGWLSVHPGLCAEELGPFDLTSALRVLCEVAQDLGSDSLLSDNKCQDPADPIEVLRQGFSEQLAAMLQAGISKEQIQGAMKCFLVEK